MISILQLSECVHTYTSENRGENCKLLFIQIMHISQTSFFYFVDTLFWRVSRDFYIQVWCENWIFIFLYYHQGVRMQK